MRELLRTNDPVLMNFIESLLGEAGIEAVILDGNMSVLEGSIGAIPRRILVTDENETAARQLLRDADLGKWLVDE
ncbi:MAG: DUF2007 domain-containing protein [Alphaproteobacteria bacterium]|nr:DUF2007 domain-containing protein [Alphaproteobacteria bacterium]